MAINSKGHLQFGGGQVGTFDITESGLGFFATSGLIHSDTAFTSALLNGFARSTTVDYSLGGRDTKWGAFIGPESGFTNDGLKGDYASQLLGNVTNEHAYDGGYWGVGMEARDVDFINKIPGAQRFIDKWTGTYIANVNAGYDIEYSTSFNAPNGQEKLYNYKTTGPILYQLTKGASHLYGLLPGGSGN